MVWFIHSTTCDIWYRKLRLLLKIWFIYRYKLHQIVTNVFENYWEYVIIRFRYAHKLHVWVLYIVKYAKGGDRNIAIEMVNNEVLWRVKSKGSLKRVKQFNIRATLYCTTTFLYFVMRFIWKMDDGEKTYITNENYMMNELKDIYFFNIFFQCITCW